MRYIDSALCFTLRTQTPDESHVEVTMRVLIALISVLFLIVPSFLAADTLPRELSDEAFWRLISDFSEQAGVFRFEYMSNEQQFQYVIPRLKENGRPGGVYLGVGP